MKPLLAALLVGVLHVHHEPSHDSDASFESLRDAACNAGLDFVVLTEHADVSAPAALPAIEHAGVQACSGRAGLLVLVGAEFDSADGHVLGLAVSRSIPAAGRRGREVIADIRAQGGFAVVAHPFSHGGWKDWEADFDGLEIQNNASDFRRLYGPLLPLRLLQHVLRPDAALRALWLRPDRELAKWDELLAQDRRVVGFAGADAHRNVSLLGHQFDPYEQMFRGVQTVCPGVALESEAIWTQLREGRCWIRYAFYTDRRDEAREVRFPSGRVELQLDAGRRVLELRNPED